MESSLRELRATEQAVPTKEELIKRAELLLPRLRERGRQEEQNRRLSDETIADLVAAGFTRILQPRRFGGYGLNWDTASEVTRILASASGSAGWIANLFITHNFQAALFPLQAQEEYWAAGEDVCCSTASAFIRSDLREVEGGFRLSGHWKFASGCDFASWFMILKPSAACGDWMLVPRSQVTIRDDWFVAGLCASGSRDIILEDVFVPEHRVVRFADIVAGTTPGGLLHKMPVARLAIFQAGIWMIPSVMVGMVTGMTDAVRTALTNKRGSMAGEIQHERAANQIKLAEAYTDVETATLVMRNRLATLIEMDKSGVESLGPLDSLASHRDAAYVARMVARVAGNLSLMAGATSVHLGSPVQRFLRDINVAATHVSLGWEEAAENYGRALWNLPAKRPGI